MTSLTLFGTGLALMLLTVPIRVLERRQMRKWFLSSQVPDVKNIIVAYIDRKRWTLSRMGFEVSRLQIVLGAIGLIDFMAVLPFAFHESWELALIFAGMGAAFFDLGIRLYGLRFNVRFERGLRTSALPIGIESLTATGEAETAVADILHLSRDKVILREFQAVTSIVESLKIPYEEAIMLRAEAIRVPAYLWLARYTLKLRQYGANAGEAWQDVREELEDKDMLRTRVLSKTASIRWGVYGFAAALIIALLLFFHLIIPLMQGIMPVVFGGIMISVAVGLYRIARLGGDIK